MKKSWTIWSLLGLVLLFAAACKDDDSGPTESEIEKQLLEKQIEVIAAYLQQQNITATMDAEGVSRGLFRQVVQANPDGEPVLDGYVAQVNYKISTLDGALIGASQPGKPVWIGNSSTKFNYLPLALKFGLNGMRVGETHRFYVPSNYAYKKYNNGENIQEDTNIVLEMEVVGVYHNWEEITDVEQDNIVAWLNTEGLSAEALTTDSLLFKVLLQQGTGVSPANSDSVWVNYKGYLLSKQVFDENQEGKTGFILGKDGEFIAGFEQAVQTMQIGEKALFVMPSANAYRNSGWYVLPFEEIAGLKEKKIYNGTIIPPFATLVFEIELVRGKRN